MSDHQSSYLYAVREFYLSSCFGKEVGNLLAGKDIPIQAYPDGVRSKCDDRFLSIDSRGAWFQEKLSLLQETAGVTGLEFLFNDSHSQRYTNIITDDNGKRVWQETHGYSLLNSQHEQIVDATRRIEHWCMSNVEAASELLDIYPVDLKSVYAGAFFTLNPSMEGFDDGFGAEYMFCILKTIREIVLYSKSSGCWCVHQKTLNSGP